MKKRIQVSLDPDLVKTAKQIMSANKFGRNFSGFLEHLIRMEWQRRQSHLTGCGTAEGCEPVSGLQLNEKKKPSSTVTPGTAARVVDTVQAQVESLKYKLHTKRK